MNIGFHFRDALRKVSTWLEEELDRLIAGIQAWSQVEHHDDGTHSAVTAESLTATTVTATTATIAALTATSGEVSLGTGGISIDTGTGLTPQAAHGYTFTGVPATVLSGFYAGTFATTNKVMIHNDVETHGWTAQVELLTRDHDNDEAYIQLSCDDSQPAMQLEVTAGARDTGIGISEVGGVKLYWSQAVRNDLVVDASGTTVTPLLRVQLADSSIVEVGPPTYASQFLVMGA